MRRTALVLSLALAAAACATTPAARAEPGTLVIVGGGLAPDNEEVFSAFLNARRAPDAPIAIIAAASGEPRQSADAFRDSLALYGVDPARVEVVRLAVVDDPSTYEIDESDWADNAADPDEIDRIRRAGAIWFTGGDQSRITGLLLGPDGRDTPMLAAIRQKLAEGAVVGGTSAGAAIMSDPMIIQGDTATALLPNVPGEAVEFGRGLGFARDMLVDQHFGQRARLGRLTALLVNPAQIRRIGVGVDEDTALVLRAGTSLGQVVGRGYVTLVDARDAQKGSGGRFAAKGLKLAMGSSGDSLDLVTGTIAPASCKRPTIGNEYFSASPVSGGGMAFGSTSLEEVVGEGLLDNSAATVIERLSFADRYGVIYRFTQTDQSRGWWGRSPGGSAHYAVTGVGFDIEPIDVIIGKAGN